MTVPDASQLYDRIVHNVLQSNMKEAFSGLGFLIQQNGFGKAYDKLTETENKYRYMLRYRLEGFPDPDREQVQMGLRRQLVELAGEAYTFWMTRNSSDYYYDRIRVEKMGGSDTLEQLTTTIRESGERLTMVELVDNTENREAQAAQLKRMRERSVSMVFLKLFISDLWTVEYRNSVRSLFDDPIFYEYEKGLWVSALLLALQKRFDPEKILLLIDLMVHHLTEVSQRAIVVLALILYFYDKRIVLYPEIGLRLAALIDEYPVLEDSFVRVFFQLIRSKDTDVVTKRMQEEILPEMTKIGSAIQDKIREGEDLSDEFNPEWKNMMEDADFSVKMQQFSDMQLEGIDVYMSTFSAQKGYPFFLEFSNWFLPFNPAHSALAELFSNDAVSGVSVLDAIVKSDYLCSSDKYSFCFNLLQVPPSYRSSMSAQMGADSEAFEEIKKSEMSMNKAFRQEQASNRYIHDLYRFFYLHHRKRDFINMFSLPLDFHNTKSMGFLVRTEDALRRIGRLYFKNKHFGHALMVIDRVLALNPTDSELQQKRGFCLQQLDQPQLALAAYLQADLIQPDSLWTLKRIAANYRQIKNPQKALEYYRRAEALATGDLSLLLNIGHTLVDSGDYAGALNEYFKAEVLSEESPRTWRPIAWCSFMCRKYDQAAKYYGKILSLHPQLEDYLNAGHVEWCKGFPLNAVDLYKRGIRASHTILPDFLELFKKDQEELIRHGIPADDISALRDELIYELEE
jgi:tetratricopeptide (TPR) repeat protein